MQADLDKASLIHQLEATQREGMQTLATLDPEAVIYSESGWTVKDFVAHLSAWDEETALSFEAYAVGNSYSIANYVHYDLFNAEEYQQRKDLVTAEVYTSWDAARDRIRAAVERLSVDQIAGEMVYPSGKRGNCKQLIVEVIEHQELHFNDIFSVIGRPGGL